MVSAIGRRMLYAPAMPRAVLLHHRLPDGSSHYDWMIQRVDDPAGSLVTFRVWERIDLGGVVSFDAERLADHRAEYLDYEGVVSGGRGEVVRIARGEIEIVRDEPRRFEAAGLLGHARGVWTAHPTSRREMQFTFAGGVDPGV